MFPTLSRLMTCFRYERLATDVGGKKRTLCMELGLCRARLYCAISARIRGCDRVSYDNLSRILSNIEQFLGIETQLEERIFYLSADEKIYILRIYRIKRIQEPSRYFKRTMLSTIQDFTQLK